MGSSQTLTVGGMTCTGCENRIKTALGSLADVQSVNADHGAGTVSVVAADGAALSESEVRSTIEGLGYTVAV